MTPQVIWQLNGNNPDNGANLTKISKFWTALNNREISWRQRILPPSGKAQEIDWEWQRFDEKFKLQNPQLRGITLYWQKPDTDQERSTTPWKLELDTQQLQLYVYPQSQKNLVIRVGIPEVVYQKIEITNPQWESDFQGENHRIILRDKQQQIEVKLTLSPENIAQLKENLPG